jgi:hypothetical protein
MEPPASPAILPSLAPLTRGLSALFWGLPLALVVSAQTASSGLLFNLGIVPPLLVNVLVAVGVFQLGRFHQHERIWVQALDRTRLMALVNVGLSPFLYWSRVLPHELYFRLAVGLMAVSGLLFLFNLNLSLRRLAAMLPDETLRQETRLFTQVNQWLILTTLVLVTAMIAGRNLDLLPLPLAMQVARFGLPVLLLLVLLPVALTMTMLWKTKETVLASAFSHPPLSGPGE